MRLFIAIDIPRSAKETLSLIKNEFLKLDSARLVSDENLHLTMKFLGDVPDEKVPNIITSIQQVKFQAFKVHLEKVGVFSDLGKPRILWVSIAPEDQLMRLKNEIDQSIPKLKDDKPFKNHITLARFNNASQEDRQMIQEKIDQMKEIPKSEILISSITLYKSTLTQKGPVYEKIV